MGLIAIDPNAGTVYRQGCWLWRKDLLLDTVANLDRQALFRLPTGTRLLHGFIDVTVIDSGTALTGDLFLEQDAGDLLLTATARNLAALGRTAIDVPDEGVLTDHLADGTPIDLTLVIDTSTAPGGDAVVTVGINVAREDYDKAT